VAPVAFTDPESLARTAAAFLGPATAAGGATGDSAAVAVPAGAPREAGPDPDPRVGERA